MKLTNSTKWSTRDLRALIIAGLKAEGMDPSRYRITVGMARKRRVSGWAYLDSHRIHMRLASPAVYGRATLDPAQRDEFARVLVHEIAHTRGVGHDDMDRCAYHCISIAVPWAAAYEVRARTTKAKPDRVAIRESRTVSALAAWQRRLKLAQTKVRKLRQRVRYYERRKAAGSVQADALPLRH